MTIAYRSRTLTRPVPEEEILEKRLDRDRAIHAAVKSRRHRRTVARDHAITVDEVDAAIERIESSLRALEKACPPQPAEPAKWPPARIRNVLVRQFGVPEDRTDDAAYLSEVLTRASLLTGYFVNEGTVRSVEAFLASRGQVLND